jgi:hypothetical protein
MAGFFAAKWERLSLKAAYIEKRIIYMGLTSISLSLSPFLSVSPPPLFLSLTLPHARAHSLTIKINSSL